MLILTVTLHIRSYILSFMESTCYEQSFEVLSLEIFNIQLCRLHMREVVS